MYTYACQNLHHPSRQSASCKRTWRRGNCNEENRAKAHLSVGAAKRLDGQCGAWRFASITFTLDHGVMRHLHASVGAAASLQRPGHTVAELEVGVRDVCTEWQLEVGIGEPTDDEEIAAVRRRRHSASRWHTASPCHLTQHAPAR